MIEQKEFMSSESLFHSIEAKSNDYTALENIYCQVTGGHLTSDPFRSPFSRFPTIDLTVTVVIAAWNASDTIQRCLTAIEQSSFNQRYPHLLQAVVVDDGSTDSTWSIIQNLDLDLQMVAVRQENHSQPFAMNTALSIAEGDIIISCDADMILTTFAIEELVKRHQLLDRVLLVGFRYDVLSDDPGIDRTNLRDKLPFLLPCFYLDNRLTYHWDGHIYPGWPENMCTETTHFKALGHGYKVFLPDGDYWSLPRMVYGALFSMRREEWEQIGGFDERFFGWGWSDTFVGAKAIALGSNIIPVYSATGAHVAHKPRSLLHKTEGRSNRHLYHQLLHTTLQSTATDNRAKAKARIKARVVRSNRSHGRDVNPIAYERLERELGNPDFLGSYLYALGRCEEAIAVYHNGFPTAPARYQALFQIGRIQRKMRRIPEAIESLEEASSGLPVWGRPLVELALAYAAAGRFNAAREKLACAYEIGLDRPLIRYILRPPSQRHIRRGRRYEAQGYYLSALQDFEAALIQDSSNRTAQQDRSRILDHLGYTWRG